MNKNKANVKVFVRSRPSTRPLLLSMNNTTTTITNPKNQEHKHFHFDGCLWSTDGSVSQEDTYDIIAHDVLEHTLKGYNTCIFAYGQTGSGKSHTMMGDDDGIIPRCCMELFDKCNDLPENVKTQIRVSYLEIYNEEVYDLLDQRGKRRVREDPLTGPYVEGLKECSIAQLNDFAEYMALGNQNRTTASTQMNNQSSRSHAVFTISLRSTEFVVNDEIKEINSCLRLVDLAGSERVNSTKATGVRFKEGSNINKSLTTLGRVISSLTNKTVVPYRDSTLTWLLKESLGGNSKTVMIACVSPSDYDETISTLRYASLVKKVQLTAQINVEQVQLLNQQQLLEMSKEIERLKSMDKDNTNQISNMTKFFENQLIDQQNKYLMIKRQLQESNAHVDKLQGDLNSILSVIKPDTGDIELHHTRLLNKSQEFKDQLDKDLVYYAI